MRNLAYVEEIAFELLNGKIVSMSPRPAINHNIVVVNISTLFKNYLKGKSCIPFSDGVDVFLTEYDRVIPDVMIVCRKEIIKRDGVYGAPDLIVEVLSPNTAKKDKGYKKDLYEKCGVREYWIVDTLNQSIEVYLLKDSKFILDEVYSIYPEYLLEKMTDEEKEQIKNEFTTTLYPDLMISLSDVFDNLFF